MFLKRQPASLPWPGLDLHWGGLQHALLKYLLKHTGDGELEQGELEQGELEQSELEQESWNGTSCNKASWNRVS